MQVDLRARRKELGLTMKEVAKRVGVDESTVSRWESGDVMNMKRNRVIALANVLRISPMDILDFAEVGPLPSGSAVIDHLAHVSAGYGTLGDEDILEKVQVPLFCLRGYSPKEIKMLTVKGDSMYPRFLDGDRIIFHLQPSVDSGDIGIIQYGDDEVTLKKIEYTKDEISLIPFNPEYQTKVIKGSDLMSCHVIGKVIYLMRNV